MYICLLSPGQVRDVAQTLTQLESLYQLVDAVTGVKSVSAAPDPISSMQRWCRFMTIDDAFELTIFSHGIKSFNSNCYCYARQLFRPTVVIARNAHFISSLSGVFCTARHQPPEKRYYSIRVMRFAHNQLKTNFGN